MPQLFTSHQASMAPEMGISHTTSTSDGFFGAALRRHTFQVDGLGTWSVAVHAIYQSQPGRCDLIDTKRAGQVRITFAAGLWLLVFLPWLPGEAHKRCRRKAGLESECSPLQ